MGKKKAPSHGMAALFDAPRSASVWPEPEITETSESQTILSTVPDYIERACEALSCIKSRLERKNLTTGILTPAQTISVEMMIRDLISMRGTMERMRKCVDGIIAEGIAKKEDSGLF